MNVCLFCNILCSIIPFFLSQFSTNMTVVWFVGFTIKRCPVLYTQYFLLFDSYFTNTLSVFFPAKSEREFSFAFFRNCAFHECLFIL